MTLDLAEASIAGSIITVLAGAVVAFVRASAAEIRQKIDHIDAELNAEINKIWNARESDVRDASGFRAAMLVQIGNVPTRAEFIETLDRSERRILAAISMNKSAKDEK